MPTLNLLVSDLNKPVNHEQYFHKTGYMLNFLTMLGYIIFALLNLALIGPSKLYSGHGTPITHPSVEHRLAAKRIFLDYLELEDHSVWEIAPPDVRKVVGWEINDTVVLIPHSSWFSIYDYKYSMINLTRDSYVRVNFTSHPSDYAQHTRWVVSIDKYSNKLFLNDGSSWKIDPEQALVLKEWNINDFIVYGRNDKHFTSYPFLLINTRLNQTVCATEF